MKETFIYSLLHSFSPTPMLNAPSSGTTLGNSRDHDGYSDKKPSKHPPITSRSIPPSVASRSTTPVPQPTERAGALDDLPEPVHHSTAIPPHQLPEDLRVCLDVIQNNLLENHTRFGKALKMRWEEQRTPVRSIEDILVEYVCYLSPFVCHRLTVSARPTF